MHIYETILCFPLKAIWCTYLGCWFNIIVFLSDNIIHIQTFLRNNACFMSIVFLVCVFSSKRVIQMPNTWFYDKHKQQNKSLTHKNFFPLCYPNYNSIDTLCSIQSTYQDNWIPLYTWQIQKTQFEYATSDIIIVAHPIIPYLKDSNYIHHDLLIITKATFPAGY